LPSGRLESGTKPVRFGEAFYFEYPAAPLTHILEGDVEHGDHANPDRARNILFPPWKDIGPASRIEVRAAGSLASRSSTRAAAETPPDIRFRRNKRDDSSIKQIYERALLTRISARRLRKQQVARGLLTSFKRKTKMRRVNHVDTTVSNHSRMALQVPIQICSDDARQGDMAHNTLYVLGFGLAGTILANGLILVFFTWSWAPT
jgi:hypothetical protein